MYINFCGFAPNNLALITCFILLMYGVCQWIFPGALTKNIMAMKERLEGDLAKDEQTGLPIITEAQRRKEREMVMKEVCVCVCVTISPL